MNFKETLAQDLNVFINIDEFGEIAEIDEVKLPAIIIEHTGDKKHEEVASKHEAFYIHPVLHGILLIGDYIEVYFKTADYVAVHGRIPKNSEFVYVNSKRYRVERAMDEQGITLLVVAADRMNTPRQIPRLQGIYD